MRLVGCLSKVVSSISFAMALMFLLPLCLVCFKHNWCYFGVRWFTQLNAHTSLLNTIRQLISLITSQSTSSGSFGNSFHFFAYLSYLVDCVYQKYSYKTDIFQQYTQKNWNPQDCLLYIIDDTQRQFSIHDDDVEQAEWVCL